MDFKASHPDTEVDDRILAEFLAAEGNRITALRESLWPGRPDVSHWSLLKIQKRIDMLGGPYDEIYTVEYPLLRWYVHAGLTGFADLPKVSLELMVAMIEEFKLENRDPRIRKRMDYARMLPWTEGQEELAS